MINFANFKGVVGKKIPTSNYVWAFYGNLQVVTAGTYHFCTSSDDGSLLYVYGVRVVDNDGEHGRRERCGNISLVIARSLCPYTASYMRARY